MLSVVLLKEEPTSAEAFQASIQRHKISFYWKRKSSYVQILIFVSLLPALQMTWESGQDYLRKYCNQLNGIFHTNPAWPYCQQFPDLYFWLPSKSLKAEHQVRYKLQLQARRIPRWIVQLLSDLQKLAFIKTFSFPSHPNICLVKCQSIRRTKVAKVNPKISTKLNCMTTGT